MRGKLCQRFGLRQKKCTLILTAIRCLWFQYTQICRPDYGGNWLFSVPEHIYFSMIFEGLYDANLANSRLLPALVNLHRGMIRTLRHSFDVVHTDCEADVPYLTGRDKLIQLHERSPRHIANSNIDAVCQSKLLLNTVCHRLLTARDAKWENIRNNKFHHRLPLRSLPLYIVSMMSSMIGPIILVPPNTIPTIYYSIFQESKDPHQHLQRQALLSP